MTRRELLQSSGGAILAANLAPLTSGLALAAPMADRKVVRCLNVVNFIRGVEPRFETDLLLPVRRQMEIVREHRLPATWLLQFDALVSGPFVAYLKANMAREHEIGFWFEMNEMHCRAAGVEWRGRPGFEWDHYPDVAFTIGYSPEERIRLADAAMAEFRRVFGRTPKSVASWNLDAITMAHLVDRYGVQAFAVCRDQIATDGFTIWGPPFAGYYPSRTNAWSPAGDRRHQISAPVFRMLGQDPVYYYDNRTRMPGGKVVREPDTMEPVWTSGRSPLFIRRFLEMIAESPTLDFAYAQLGQENSFPWGDMEPAFGPQMAALARSRDEGRVHVETMGDSGRRFRREFRSTPAQAQVMLDDPFGNVEVPEGSIWYASRFYRLDLHIKGDLPYLRDLTVYTDRSEQPFLRRATREKEVQQRLPAVLDGYHWSKTPGSLDEIGAGGFFALGDERLRLAGRPKVTERGTTLEIELPVQAGRRLTIRCEERRMTARISSPDDRRLSLRFEWDAAKATLSDVADRRAAYRWNDLEYGVEVEGGTARREPDGWRAIAERAELRLDLAQ